MSFGEPTATDIRMINAMWTKGSPREFLELFPQNSAPGAYYCDGCKNTIEPTHPRFRCLECDDFDYCLMCKTRSSTTHPGHLFRCFEQSFHATDPRPYLDGIRAEVESNAVTEMDDDLSTRAQRLNLDSPTQNELFTAEAYTPLNLDNDEIRVLSILPGSYTDPVRCNLEQVSIFGVQYAALSYEWGIGPDACTIQLNGLTLPVRANLFDALVALRKETDIVHVWVDAICINQNDVDEKSKEVQRLRQIYAQSQKVIVWLGRGSEDSDLAMDLVNGAPLISIGVAPMHAGWPALDRLVRRRWWSRVWCIQELSMAYWSPVVMCGSRWTVWYKLSIMANKLTEYWANLMSPLSHLTALSHGISFYGHGLTFEGLGSIRTQFTSSVNLDLLYLLEMTLGYQATDPRDKIYALLGICRRRDREAIIPDYRKNVRDVLIETSKHLVQENLNALCFNINSPPDDRFTRLLPSWVSNWILGSSRPRPLWRRCIYSAGRVQPDTAYVADVGRVGNLETLSVMGSELGKVQSTSNIIIADDTWTSVNTASLYRTIRDAEMFFAPRFPESGPSDLSMIWRTLIVDAHKPQVAWVSPASDRLGEAYMLLRRRAWEDFAYRQILGAVPLPQIKSEDDERGLVPSFDKDQDLEPRLPSMEREHALSHPSRDEQRSHVAATQMDFNLNFSIGSELDRPEVGEKTVVFSIAAALKTLFFRVTDPCSDLLTATQVNVKPQDGENNEPNTYSGPTFSKQDSTEGAENILRIGMHTGTENEPSNAGTQHEEDGDSDEAEQDTAISEDDIQSYIYLAKSTLQKRRLFFTDNGWVGLSSEDIHEGDSLAILEGGDMPFILRDHDQDIGDGSKGKQPAGQADTPKRLISEAYVYNAMDGDVFSSMPKSKIVLA